MAWTVDNIFSFVKFLTRKNQTAAITPTEFFLSWNAEQRSRMGELLGKLRAKAGQPNAGLIENQLTQSELSPFTITTSIAIAITGSASKPSNLIYLLAARVGDYPVHLKNKGQIYSIINNAIDPPSVANNMYYGTEYDTFYKIWPASAGTLSLDYIRNCTDVVFGYTLDANSVAQYDAGTSTQPEWDDIEIQEITKRTLKLFGVSMSDRSFMEFGESVINKGA
jgi:hypothetical protein